jgi:hypothetical protein
MPPFDLHMFKLKPYPQTTLHHKANSAACLGSSLMGRSYAQRAALSSNFLVGNGKVCRLRLHCFSFRSVARILPQNRRLSE